MKKIPDSGHRLLTRAEVAEMFQVSPSTVTRWAEAGKLPVVKTLGGHRRYDAEVILELTRHFTAESFQQADITINEEPIMEKIAIDVPAMYGDHHVLEVRGILLAAAGVKEVYASSCFRSVEVSFDPGQTNADEITHLLDEAGYLEPLRVPAESGVAVTEENGQKAFFRHTTAFEQAKQVVSFAQNVAYTERVLWPCPGVGVLRGLDLEQEVSNG